MLVRSSLLVVALAMVCASHAFAQAWLPPEREGSVSFSYQRIDNTGHKLTDGRLVPGGKSLDMSLYLEVEYAPVSRLSLTVGLPFVFAKYTDPNPPPPPLPFLPVDQCHCWHEGIQDFSFSARYSLLSEGWFAVTPIIAAGVPSQNYNYRGEAALGRNLREIRVGVDVGQRLDRVLRNLSVQEHYTYAFVQKILGIPNNRSNGSIDVTYVFKRRLAPHGFVAWQVTHGGLRLGSLPPSDLVFPGEVNTPTLLQQHDRLLRDDNFRAGGGVSYSFSKMDWFFSYVGYVSGTDTHAGRAISLGVSVPFSLKRAKQ
jgi:hypothetical protein